MRALSLFVVAVTCLVAARPGLAQTVGVFRTAAGARASALAGADSALGTTPIEALTFNPAGLADIREREIGITLGTVSATGSFSNRVDGAGRLGDAHGVIPEGAVAWRLRSRAVVGAGVVADGAVGGDWRYQDAPGIGGVTYGHRTHRSAIRVARATAGVGVAVSDRLNVGASLSALRNDNRLTAPYIFQSQAPLVGLKTLLDIETGGWGIGASVGVTARASDRLVVGAAYRTATSLTTQGTASGDVGAQLDALGLEAPGAFTYRARVANRFPQQASLAARLRVSRNLLLLAQADWWDWSRAFRELAITLEDGSNGVINSVVGGSTIRERVPLRWRDQVVRRGGAEYAWRGGLTLRGGYAYGGRVVPSDTLTPMTAAIIEHTVGMGLGLRAGRGTLDVAFQVSPVATRAVGRSSLAGSGEYDGTQTRVGMRAVSMTWTRRF